MEGEADYEAQVVQETHEEVEEQEIINADGAETPDIDDEAKMAILHRMQQEQEAIARRITRHKKHKKKKKARPQTAKYNHGMMNRSKYSRPWTATQTRPKKKKKAKKRNAHDTYLEQLRQQQLLQQLALEQQNMDQEQQENKQEQQEDGEIQITPEQAILLYQQFEERHQNGEELSEEEMQQFQFLHNLLEQHINQQQQLQQQAYQPPKKSRKKSKKKSKKKTKNKNQKMDENALLMMMQNQQLQQMQNEQFQHDQLPYNQPNVELPEGVDEIKEVDEEETPVQEMIDRPRYHPEGEGEGDTADLQDTEIPTQINAQVPAHFGNQQLEEEKMNEYEQMSPEEQQNLEMMQNLTPGQLYQLQQMQQQVQYAPEESNASEMDAKYAEDKANNMAVLQHIIDVGAQNGVVKKDLLSILPLSQSVANAKKKFKTMKKYDLDIYDKKMRKNLTTAQLAPDSEHYFQAILRQSLESALNPKEVSKNNNFSKFTVPLLKYCKKNGLKSFMVSSCSF